MDAQAETIERLERANEELTRTLSATREELYRLSAKVIVDPKLRADLLSQINHLKAENNRLKSKLGNLEKARQESDKTQAHRPRKGEDSILTKMRELYPDFWQGR